MKFKNLIIKHFSSFTYFYRFVRFRIFILFFLGVAAGVLDSFGLSMFLPVLQILGGDGSVDRNQMGSLAFLGDAADALNITISLKSVLFVLITFFIFKGIATFFHIFYLTITQQSFIKRIRLKLLQSLISMDYQKFIHTDPGRVQNSMSGEVDRVAQAFVSYFASMHQALMVMVYLTFAFFIDFQLAALVSIGGLLTNLINRNIYIHTKNNSRRLTLFNHNYQGLIIQYVNNFKYLRATGIASDYAKKLVKSVDDIEQSKRKLGILVGIGSAAREPVMIIVIALVILVQISFFGTLFGTMILSLLFFYRALTSLGGFQTRWNEFLTVSGSLENMKDFQKELESSREVTGNLSFSHLTKSICCTGLTFSFGKAEILKNINLSIEKNSSVAFVGQSGSGKTTLINVVAGLLKPDQGMILVDGIELHKLNKTTYQKRIGYITQEPVIFNDTLFNNVSFWAEKTPLNIERVQKALEQSVLKEFVSDLPETLETPLGNNGINLSGGQKQRISIARELYKDVDILIMDEATSSLDSETEKSIQENIEALKGKYTLIIVAHRLATVRNVEKIVFMHKGVIQSEGNFNHLMRNPQFENMVSSQKL